MRGPRRRPRRRLIGLLLIPPVVWALVLMFLPTGWARRLIERRVEQVSGCPTQLKGLRIGPLGGVHLLGLAVREPEGNAEAPPWIEAESVRVDLRLADLLVGNVEPHRVTVRGLRLRLVRRDDGCFAPFHLLCQADAARPAIGGRTDDDEAGPIAFRLDGGKVTYIDPEDETILTVDALNCWGTWWPAVVELDALTGALNGGRLALAGEVERGPAPAFAAQFRARGVHLGSQMGLLRYLVPFLAGVDRQLEGRLDLDLELKGHGPSRDDLRDSLVGRGSLRVDPIRLDGSSLLVDLARVLPVTGYGRVGSLHTDFTVQHRKVLSRELTVKAGGTPIVLKGGAGFNGWVDYRVDCSSFAGQFGPEGFAVLAELGLRPDDLLDLRVRGTIARPRVLAGGLAIGSGTGDTVSFEELARRIRGQFFR